MDVRLEIEYKPCLFAPANTDLLLGRILKAALRDLYNVVLEFEIRQAQLPALRELPLKFSVDKNFCFVLTGDDNEGAQVVTGLDGWARCGCRCGGGLINGCGFFDGVGRRLWSRCRGLWD